MMLNYIWNSINLKGVNDSELVYLYKHGEHVRYALLHVKFRSRYPNLTRGYFKVEYLHYGLVESQEFSRQGTKYPIW